jgi:hypothetical protein
VLGLRKTKTPGSGQGHGGNAEEAQCGYVTHRLADVSYHASVPASIALNGIHSSSGFHFSPPVACMKIGVGAQATDTRSSATSAIQPRNSRPSTRLKPTFAALSMQPAKRVFILETSAIARA